ncbi:hypothetical protein [Flavihumibacter petaseus]|nr:hypothetical protein [Flavihumibacter petaseus]
MFSRFPLLSFVLLSGTSLNAQETTDTSGNWTFGASGYYYVVPGEQNTLTFITTADRGRFHMEGRFNYEDRNTASLFGGYTLSWGNKLRLEATPMLGIAFGQTNGLVPAIEWTLSWRKLEYYAETEAVLDFTGEENWFLYTWGTLSIQAFRNFQTGFVYQRTRLYNSDYSIQKGCYAAYSFKSLTPGLYYFNPFTASGLLVVSLSVNF